VSLGLTSQKLRALGVETLAVVATPVERARRYFKLRPPRCTVAADADLATHRAFGVPQLPMDEDLMRAVVARQDELAGEIGLAVGPGGSREALDHADGIDHDEFRPDIKRHGAQAVGQFLIDRAGIIRWSNIEIELDGIAGVGGFPTDDELLAAAKAL